MLALLLFVRHTQPSKLPIRSTIDHDANLRLSGETSRNMLSGHFLPIVLDVMPLRSPRHTCLVGPTYDILALLELSAYFLGATSYKRMRLITSISTVVSIGTYVMDVY